MIREAKRSYPGYDFRVIDMIEVGSLPETFHLAFLIASLHHLDSRSKCLQVLHGLFGRLEPGGYVMMTNWNLLSPENRSRYGGDMVNEHDFMIKIGSAKRYYHAFECRELEDLAEECGYRIVENRIFQ